MKLNPILNVCLFVSATICLLSEDACSKQDIPDGIRFHRNEDGFVDAVEYWGTIGLRAAKLHEHSRLKQIGVVYGTTLSADDVAYLSTLTRVTDLAIGQELIDAPVEIEGDLALLAGMKSLVSLHLCKHDIENDDLQFVGSLPKLRYLEFNADSDFKGGGSAVTDRCAEYLGRATSLESISIQGHGKLTDKFVISLTESLTDLEHLRLSCPELTDQSLNALATKSSKLKWVDLDSDQFTDAGLKSLCRAQNLEMLWIDSNALTSDSAESLTTLKQLKHLGLTVKSIDDAGISAIASLPKLEILALRRPPLTDHQFSMLHGHPSLRSAFINGKRLSTENVLKIIRTIPNLEHLAVRSDQDKHLQTRVNQAISQKENRN